MLEPRMATDIRSPPGQAPTVTGKFSKLRLRWTARSNSWCACLSPLFGSVSCDSKGSTLNGDSCGQSLFQGARRLFIECIRGHFDSSHVSKNPSAQIHVYIYIKMVSFVGKCQVRTRPPADARLRALSSAKCSRQCYPATRST